MTEKQKANWQAYRRSQWIWIPFFAMQAWTHRHREGWILWLSVAMLIMVTVAWTYSWLVLRSGLQQQPSHETEIQGQN